MADAELIRDVDWFIGKCQSLTIALKQDRREFPGWYDAVRLAARYIERKRDFQILAQRWNFRTLEDGSRGAARTDAEKTEMMQILQSKQYTPAQFAAARDALASVYAKIQAMETGPVATLKAAGAFDATAFSNLINAVQSIASDVSAITI